MKKLALPLLTLALALTACGRSEEPAAAPEGGTVVKEGKEWTADAQPGAVDVKLPDTPVEVGKDDAGAAPQADKEDAAKPAKED